MRTKYPRFAMERLFLLLYIPLALAMMLIMPVGGPPDELTHLGQEWLLSTGQIRTETTVFPANLQEILNTQVTGTQDAAALNGEIRGVRLSTETVTGGVNELTGIYPLAAYAPQSLTMFLTRLVTDRIDLLCYGARIGSMIMTGLLFWSAIRRSPAGKATLLAIACLPLTLQEAASASCDGITIAGICWITAELLRRISGQEERKTPALLRSAGMGAGAVLCKLLYFPVLLLGLIARAETAEEKKKKRNNNLIMAGTFLAAMAVWYILSVRSLSGRQGLTDGALTRLGQVAADPLILIGAQVRTLIHRAPGWTRQLFGVFGRLDVFSPWSLTVLLGLSFLGVALTDDGAGVLLKDRKQARRFRILMICAFLLCWELLSGALLVWWTAEGNPLIEGIQGRYFLPALFGLLLCLPECMKNNPARRKTIRMAALGVFIACSAATVILLGARL